MDTVWLISAALVMLVASIAGVAITLLTFPGLWLTLLVGLALQLLWPGEPLFSWWTFGIAVGLAVIAEVIEFVSAAAGAKKSGGGRSAAWGAIVGSLVGAFAGSFVIPIPVLGTIAGAVIGAGMGATAGDRGIAGKSWKDSLRAGTGAAKGRLIATVVKTALAALIGLILTGAVLIP